MNLAARSVEVILAGQSPAGSYVACPNFENYRFSWFRDGCFIADAMRVAGEVESADRFFDWCARVVHARPEGPWDARYTLGGEPDRSEWPKLQTDGPGLYLWALRRRGRWDESADLVARWLGNHWGEPCVDWWEERDGVHAVTLGCIWAATKDEETAAAARAACERERVDGSHAFLVVLGLADAPVLDRVLLTIGYHRHADDEYYGGGEWPVVAGLIGWAHCMLGLEAAPQLEWIEDQADSDGMLPEQAGDRLRPERYATWVERWGPPASPLLWSHAMYLILVDAATT